MDFHCKVRLHKKNQRDSKSMEGKSIKQIHLAAAHMSQLLLCVSNSNLRNHPCFVTSSARSLKDKEDIIPTNLKHLFQKRGTQHLMAFDWSCWVLPPRLPINSWGFNFFPPDARSSKKNHLPGRELCGSTPGRWYHGQNGTSLVAASWRCPAGARLKYLAPGRRGGAHLLSVVSKYPA